jgi:hypothetical protein
MEYASVSIWLYDRSRVPEETLLQGLRTSFLSALNEFPHFGGQLHWAPLRKDGDHTMRFGKADGDRRL